MRKGEETRTSRRNPEPFRSRRWGSTTRDSDRVSTLDPPQERDPKVQHAANGSYSPIVTIGEVPN